MLDAIEQGVVALDRERKVVVDEDGGITPFDKLILATGSSAFIPPCLPQPPPALPTVHRSIV